MKQLVTPGKTGYTFLPASKSITISNADSTGNSFTANLSTAPTYSLSGSVILSGLGLSGVIISLSGAGTGTITTDATGNYAFTNLGNGTYTLTPSKTGYTFNPMSKSIILNGVNSTDNTFAAIAQPVLENYLYSTQWGSAGPGDGQFNSPRGIAIDSTENVYVADFFNWRIQKFNPTGQHIATWGSWGEGDGQFKGTYSVAIDELDNVYVYDTNPRIQKFTSAGVFVTKWGSYGTGNGQFSNRLVALAYNRVNGYIYLADYDNNRIQVFGKDGTYITQWGTLGVSDGQFQGPCNVAVDSSGNVYVVEWLGQRVQKFTSTGTFVSKLNISALGIAIDSTDMIYLVNFDDSVVKYATTGLLLAQWSSIGSTAGLLNDPYGIAVNNAGSVYVVDTGVVFRINPA